MSLDEEQIYGCHGAYNSTTMLLTLINFKLISRILLATEPFDLPINPPTRDFAPRWLGSVRARFIANVRD